MIISEAGPPVVAPGAFRFAAMHLEHGHIRAMCAGLIAAGGELAAVHDPDPAKVEDFRRAFPQAAAIDDAQRILDDPRIALVAAAAIPCDRADLGIRAMAHGKHYFTAKAPATTLAQLAAARAAAAASGRIFAVFYCERLLSPATELASRLVAEGAIGRVLHVVGLGPHRLGAGQRPGWFFRKAQYGGILVDIGSHQIEQFLHFTGAADARIAAARVANLAHPEHPELEDLGEVSLVAADDGASGYSKVDWLSPDGLGTWGDARLLLTGSDGTIELRKTWDVGHAASGDHVFIVDRRGERHLRAAGTPLPYFGRLIRDCLDGSRTAMDPERTFLAARLCLEAQAMADAGRAGA